MKQRKRQGGVSRREFLASAAAIPALAGLGSAPAFADEPRHEPPYLALKKFILPGNDEFAGEREAREIASALEAGLGTMELPLTPSCKGFSPCAASYRALAHDLQEAVYDSADTGVAEGWKRWVLSLGRVRRARFYSLAEGVVRYEVASERDGKLQYRVGRWKQSWVDGKVADFRPVEENVATAGAPMFRDVTAAAFEKTASFHTQLARGAPYWRSRLDPAAGIDIYASNGIAVGDIDGDGEDEIYICQAGGLPNRLYKLDSSGAMVDITEAWGVGLLDETSSALFLDLRNSGRQDLVVLRSGGPVLFLNEATRFRMRADAFRFATAPAGGFTGMAAADFDRDGKLDLYLCCYVYFQSEAQYTYASPYHDAQNGPPNFLFRNRLNADGSGFLDDCTAETGMNENNDRFSFAPAWCDFNGDGWPDLYVANDFGRKNLYVNENGRFRDRAAMAGVEDMGPGMSASWFDYDHDGKPDLYVANMWTEAGQRVARDKSFAPARGEAMREAYRRHTKGNSLYRNRGDGTFEETTFAQHAEFGRWAWSSGGHDLDNDGEAEIYIACGMLTNSSSVDLMGFFWRQVVARSPVTAAPSAAYENGWNALNQFIREDYSWSGREPNVLHVRRGGRYFDFSGVSGLDFPDDTRAFAVADFDGDGRADVILKSRLGPQVRLLQNDCAGANRSIAFRLRGTKSNRDAIGARIQVDRQTKWMEAGSGFLSQHSKTILFGLGEADSVARVRITWPSGAVQEFKDLRAGAAYSITEGSQDVEAKPFRPHRPLASNAVEADNELQLRDTWFLEPVPLPVKQRGPGLLVLVDGQAVPAGYGPDARVVDFKKEPADLRRQYEIFRRYLFDWRTTLETPLAFLLNSSGEAVKVYAGFPAASDYRKDLAKPGAALPFEGTYVTKPHRDFFKFGAAYLWAGYSEQALPYLEAVLRRIPENPRVLVLAGQIHLQANRTEEAEKCFRAAAGANPNYAEAWSGLGDVAETRDNGTLAVEHYEKALALKPDLLYTLLNAGLAAGKLNRQDKAEAWYREALRVDPRSAEAANGVGLALAKQGHFDEARQYFENAIALRHDFAGAINNLGVLYLQMNQVKDAIAAFTYGIREAPDEDILYLNLGRIYTRAGNFEQARQVMRQLLQRKPDSGVARHALQELENK